MKHPVPILFGRLFNYFPSHNIDTHIYVVPVLSGHEMAAERMAWGNFTLSPPLQDITVK